MDKDERLKLIRHGNELYNRGDYKSALKLFLFTDYQDGIVRVADHLFYEENDQISAIKLYKRAGYQKRIDEFAEKAALTIQLWLAEDEAGVETELVGEDELKLSKEKQKSMRIKEWEPKVIRKQDIMNLKLSGGDIDKAFEDKKK